MTKIHSGEKYDENELRGRLTAEQFQVTQHAGTERPFTGKYWDVWDDGTYHWWKVLGTLRWGLGLANQARQPLDGEFPSSVMAASGRRVAEMEYDVLMLLDGAYP